tara:strand:+ start:20112 stop:20585 length:474 start_codon:yes stop_codon:yes gene_type:complete
MGAAQDLESLANVGTALVGKDGKSKGSTTGNTITKQSQRTEIDQEGIDKIIADVLGGADGLASIFAGEQNAGIFNSSTSAQAAGDLATKLAGEIAKLTSNTVTDSEIDTEGTSKSKEEEDGLLDGITKGLGLGGKGGGIGDALKTFSTGGLNKVFKF